MLSASDKKVVIIAGPNGAGKSTNSKSFLSQLRLPINAFDWDSRFDENWGRFNYDSNPLLLEGIRNKTNEEFSRYINRAFETNLHIAYETNFHHPHNLDQIQRAKSNGYIVIVYFLYLDSISTAIQRVKKRVMKGGHNVSEETIRQRYWNGFNILNQAMPLCDYFNIWDFTENFDPYLIMAKTPDEIKLFRKIPERLYTRVPHFKQLGIEETAVRLRTPKG